MYPSEINIVFAYYSDDLSQLRGRCGHDSAYAPAHMQCLIIECSVCVYNTAQFEIATMYVVTFLRTLFTHYNELEEPIRSAFNP